MKILVTGASGLLGHDIAEYLSRKHTVVRLAGRQAADVSDTKEITSVICSERPDVVIHCAGWRDVDACERDPVKAYRINTLGTRNVCLAAQALDAKLVYISSDSVFDGEKRGAYIEFDKPNPINVYGMTKLAGEEEVKQHVRKHFIVRVPILFGIGPASRGYENTIVRTVQSARTGAALTSAADQVSSPTYTLDVACVLEVIVETEFYGTYHVSNRGSASRAVFQRTVLELRGLDPSLVSAVPDPELGRPARRQRYSVLESVCLEPVFGIVMRPWRDALVDCLARPELGRILASEQRR